MRLIFQLITWINVPIDTVKIIYPSGKIGFFASDQITYIKAAERLTMIWENPYFLTIGSDYKQDSRFELLPTDFFSKIGFINFYYNGSPVHSEDFKNISYIACDEKKDIILFYPTPDSNDTEELPVTSNDLLGTRPTEELNLPKLDSSSNRKWLFLH